MPAEFELTIGRVQVAVPLPLTSTDLPRDVRSLEVWARLKPGVSSGQADAEMAIVAGDLEREYPDANGGYGARVLTLRAFMALGPISVMYLLQGALSFVLLIACANVANILLARGLVVAMEGREFTHADRRIAEWEGVWLAALGFALGVPGVWLVSRLVQNALFGVSPRTSGTVVLAGLALFLVAVVASYVPARRAASVEPMLALRSE